MKRASADRACKGAAASSASLRRGVAAALLLALPARAQVPEPSVCQALADHITPDFVPDPLRALVAEQGGFLHVMEAEHVMDAEHLGAGLKRAVAELAARGSQAADDLAPVTDRRSRRYVISFAANDVSVIDVVGGAESCHTLVGLAGVQAGDAHQVQVTMHTGCGIDVFGAAIGGRPALLVDDEGWNSGDYTRSDLAISSLDREQFAPPCTVAIHYDVGFHAQDTSCRGVDCALVGRKAEALVASREAGGNADSLGAGAIPVGAAQMDADYQRLAALAAGDMDPRLPTFGDAAGSYNRFDATISFPMSLDDGQVYLARLGHGSFGWRSTPDYLFAAYALDGDAMRPVAGVYLKAERTRIASVQVKPLAHP